MLKSELQEILGQDISLSLQLETGGMVGAAQRIIRFISRNGLLLRAAPLLSIGKKLFYRCHIKGTLLNGCH